MSIKIYSPKLLMVEGNDENIFFQAYLAHLGITDVQIYSVGGKTNFGPSIKTLLSLGLLEGLTHLALVEDADKSAENAFKKLSNLLKIVPDTGVPKKQDSWDKDAEIAGGTFVMTAPNQQEGALEDLCLASVQENPLMLCVDDFSKCIENIYKKPKHQAKIQVQTFSMAAIKAQAFALAQTGNDKNLANSFKLSIDRKVWNFDHDCMTPLRTFLLELKD